MYLERLWSSRSLFHFHFLFPFPFPCIGGGEERNYNFISSSFCSFPFFFSCSFFFGCPSSFFFRGRYILRPSPWPRPSPYLISFVLRPLLISPSLSFSHSYHISPLPRILIHTLISLDSIRYNIYIYILTQGTRAK